MTRRAAGGTELPVSSLRYAVAQREKAGWLVKDFHYSARIPANVQEAFIVSVEVNGGLFDVVEKPIAACFCSLPPTRWKETVVELSRLVRDEAYRIPLSSFISWTVRQMRNKKYDLLISFADQTQGHHGGIYQACGWNYAGQRESNMDGLIVNGKFVPGRSCNSAWGTRSPIRLRELHPEFNIEPHYDEGKHLYWKALNNAGIDKAERLNLDRLPYPKPDLENRAAGGTMRQEFTCTETVVREYPPPGDGA